ncbi:hypothetical protein O181_130808 [Austropuccinia psidii MF-1]|uniref:Uncharacterized protein n=1 Tax=Austropuccinia psidii MF-1 TaxID=1389203 RepID=A0A9Q3QA48_9BASI|nr:hypothetical protein [Austropuccinia psidii MF-1]
MLEKGWKSKLPVDTLIEDFVEIHPPSSKFKLLLDKVRPNANKTINDAFNYAIQKCDKINKTAEFNIGDLIVASNLICNNIKGPKNLKYSFEGPFIS